MKAIDSPYVAKLFDTGEYNGLPFEVLPYYKNGSLQGRKYTMDALKNTIIPCINEALHVLHQNDIIHKDLKPSNIMLMDDNKSVAIIDFGISSVVEQGNTVLVTKTGMTPEYSAPETFRNLFLEESDYYSFGITLYELYCGETPYRNMSAEQIAQFTAVQRIPFPKDMPKELQDLISAVTYFDITNRHNKDNPNRRWTYTEVQDWCQGKKQVAVLILIVTTLVTLEGYNYYYYNRAIQAYDGADYSRAIKEFGQIIGPFGEKNSLLKDAREKIGWIYYTSSGTLYVASEDGKYLQELDKNVSYTTAQDGKYLYYLKDDRNDTYDTAYVLNMESNKKEKLPINEGIFGYYRKNGTEIYAEGEHWERGRWYFNDRGDLIVSNFYRLDGNKAYQLRDDRDNYESISEIKKVQINSWTIEERSYEGKNGLLFSNQKTSEDTFVMGQYIAIAGVYQTGR